MQANKTHKPIIKLEGISVSRTEKLVLRDMTLTLDQRRIGIVGRNGSGKSTLARTICGLQECSAGKVLINEIDVAKDRAGALDVVGILFQNPDHQIIFPTVVEEVAFGLRQQGHSKRTAEDEAKQWLHEFGRLDWADRAVATLSQGQRHLVCLISVLAMKPKVILLDEPFAGLDLPTTRQLQKLLDEVDQTLVHITHETQTLMGYERVLWIEHGRVQLDGAPEDVLEAYQTAMLADGGADAFADITD